MAVRDWPSYKTVLIILGFGCLSLVASWPMLSVDWYVTHEEFSPFERIIALSHEIEQGDWYPRWLSSAFSGQGLPFFNFYSPLFYLLASYLHAFGLPLLWSAKVVLFAVFWSGSAGMFFWARRHVGLAGGIVAAVIYLFLPYHFLDIYVRGALSEFAALAFLPYLFLGLDRSMSGTNGSSGTALTACSFCGIILTHNLTAMMISFFAVPYILAIAYSEKISWKKMLLSAAGLVAGAGLSAFYWLPVALEKAYLKPFSDTLLSSEFSYNRHFVYIQQFVSTYWGYGISRPGPFDGMSFQLGVPLLILVAFSAVALPFASQRVRRFGVIVLGLGVFGLGMTMSLSTPLYELVPALPYVQFPWRFLGPATFFLAAFSGVLVTVPRIEKYGGAVIAIVIALSIVLSTGQRQVYGAISLPAQYNDAEILRNRAIGSMSVMKEYLPVWVKREEPLSFSDYRVLPLGNVRLSSLRMVGSRLSFTASTEEQAARIRLPWFFFPGWRATSDDRPLRVFPDSDGFIVLDASSGTHEIKVWFGTTPPRVIGWAISLCTVAGLLAPIVAGSWKKRPEGAGIHQA